MAKLKYLGHASFKITSNVGVIAYIDPYAGTDYETPADLILVTHQHGDHNRIDLPARKNDTVVIQNEDALRDGKYQTFNVMDFVVTGFPAQNKKHQRTDCVGYLITVDGKKIYFAGDTSEVPEMEELKSLKLDYALLPIDGIYNMDETEAAKCAALIGAKKTIPIHMAPGGLFSEEKAMEFTAPNKLVIRPNEEISL